MKSTLGCIILIFLFAKLGLKAQPLTAIIPQNHSTAINFNINFQWNPYPNAVNYKVEMATNLGFSINYSESGLLNNTAWSTFMANQGTYYWRVKAYTLNDSTLSPTYSFSYFMPSGSQYTSLWLKADAGLVLDASNKVQQWNDLSANNNLFTQNNSTKRPTVVNNAVNGYPSLGFTGTQFLNGGDILDLGFNSRSFFVIGKMASTNQSLIAKSRAFNSTYRYGIIKDAANSAFLFQSDVNTSNYSTFNTNNYALYNAFVNRSTAKNHFDINNTSLGISSFNSNLLFESTYRLLIGAYNNANDDGEVLLLNGNICEIIFSDTYDSTEIVKIKNYIKYKYSPILTLGPDISISNGFCAQTLTATAGFTNYLWNTGASSPTISVNQSGQYWVTATDAFGFLWTDTIHVQFPIIAPPTSTAICANGNFVWSTGLGAGFTHLWNTGATSNSLNITQSGNYSVTVTGAGGCQANSGNVLFTIDTYPITTFIGNDTTLCVGNYLALQIGGPQTIQYTWNNGSNNATYLVSNLGTYTVSVNTLNANGCPAQDSINITVNGTAPSLNYLAPTVGCGNELLNFNDQSTVPLPSSILSQTWTFSNGMTGTGNSVQLAFPNAGVIHGEIEVGSSGNCVSRDTFTFFVYDPPYIQITHSGHCSNEGITFNASDTTGGNLSNFQWEFNQTGGILTSESPTHLFGNPGVQSCTLISENVEGCIDTAIYSLILNAAPQAGMIAPNGCELTGLSFNNTSLSLDTFSLQSYLWNFGDGNSSNEVQPLHSYSQEGDFSLSLMAYSSNGCSDTLNQSISIFPKPDLAWNLSPSCINGLTTFESTSTLPIGSIDSTYWLVNLQFPFAGNMGSYTFTTLGIQYLHLNATSNQGCTSDTLILVDVKPGLSSGFSYSPLVCVAGDELTLNSLALGNSNLLWQVNGQNLGTSISQLYQIPDSLEGESLIVTSITSNDFGCSDTSSATILISEPIFDLEVQNLYTSPQDGNLVMGCELVNNGTLPIQGCLLSLSLTGNPLFTAMVSDTILPLQHLYYVFPNQLITEGLDQNGWIDFICISADTKPYHTRDETTLLNNDVCKLIEEGSFAISAPYPNPTQIEFNMDIVVSEDIVLRFDIYNELGQLVLTPIQEVTLTEGTHPLTIATKTWANGVYYLKISEGTNVKIFKLIKF